MASTDLPVLIIEANDEVVPLLLQGRLLSTTSLQNAAQIAGQGACKTVADEEVCRSMHAACMHGRAGGRALKVL